MGLLTAQILGSELAKIVVGNLGRCHEFFVHKRLLCSRSEYFRGALEGGFQEAKDGIVFMPEDCPFAFEIFLSWLYAGSLSALSIDMIPQPSQLAALVKFYMLADKLMLLEDAKGSALGQIVAEFDRCPLVPLEVLIDVFRNTSSDCPLRTLLRDLYCYTCSKCTVSNPMDWENMVDSIMSHCSEEEQRELWPELLRQLQNGHPEDLVNILLQTQKHHYGAQRIRVQDMSRYQRSYSGPNEEDIFWQEP